jgi:hypothetical protein
MHNIVECTRAILFDLHPRIGLNFGILFAWCGIGTILFPLCCYYMRWNTARVKRNAARAEEAWHQQMEKQNETPTRLARITTLRSRREGETMRRRETGNSGALPRKTGSKMEKLRAFRIC